MENHSDHGESSLSGTARRTNEEAVPEQMRNGNHVLTVYPPHISNTFMQNTSLVQPT